MIYVMGGLFDVNGTTSVPKFVLRLVLDKVRLLFSYEMFCSSQVKVPNKSLKNGEIPGHTPNWAYLNLPGKVGHEGQL